MTSNSSTTAGARPTRSGGWCFTSSAAPSRRTWHSPTASAPPCSSSISGRMLPVDWQKDRVHLPQTDLCPLPGWRAQIAEGRWMPTRSSWTSRSTGRAGSWGTARRWSGGPARPPGLGNPPHRPGRAGILDRRVLPRRGDVLAPPADPRPLGLGGDGGKAGAGNEITM